MCDRVDGLENVPFRIAEYPLQRKLGRRGHQLSRTFMVEHATLNRASSLPPKAYDFWPYRYLWFYKFQPIASNGYYGKVFIRAILFPLLLLCIFLSLSSYYSFSNLFLSLKNSWPIYLGLAGIAAFIFLTGVLTPLCYSTLASLKPLFKVNPEFYEEHIDKFVGRTISGPNNVIYCVLISVPLLLLGNFVIDSHDNTVYSHDKDLVDLIRIMPSSLWYHNASFNKLWIPSAVWTIAIFFITISIRGFIAYLQLMKLIGSLNFKSPYVVPIAALRFRKVTNFNFTVSICYSVGVLLILVAININSRYAIAIIIALASVSFSIVALPYLYFSRKLRIELDTLIDQVLNTNLFGKSDFGAEGKDIHTMVEVVSLIKDLPSGIYELRLGVGNAAITTLLALAVGYLKLQ